MDKKIIGVLVVVVVLFLIPVFKSSFSTKKGPDLALDNFAKCLTDKKLVMYGADWCSHCQNEKRAFGDSFKYVNYVECPKNIKECTALGIKGYPTWIDGNGRHFEGEQGISGLSEISGCLLEK